MRGFHGLKEGEKVGLTFIKSPRAGKSNRVFGTVWCLVRGTKRNMQIHTSKSRQESWLWRSSSSGRGTQAPSQPEKCPFCPGIFLQWPHVPWRSRRALAIGRVRILQGWRRGPQSHRDPRGRELGQHRWGYFCGQRVLRLRHHLSSKNEESGIGPVREVGTADASSRGFHSITPSSLSMEKHEQRWSTTPCPNHTSASTENPPRAAPALSVQSLNHQCFGFQDVKVTWIGTLLSFSRGLYNISWWKKFSHIDVWGSHLGFYLTWLELYTN